MNNLRLAPDNDEDDLYSGYDYQDNLLDVSGLYMLRKVVTSVVFPISAPHCDEICSLLNICTIASILYMIVAREVCPSGTGLSIYPSLG